MELQTENVLKELKSYINQDMIRLILSNPRLRGDEYVLKVKILPIMNSGSLVFHVTEYQGTQVFHKNLSADETVEYVHQQLHQMKQCELQTHGVTLHILVSKKGKITVSKKNNQIQKIAQRAGIPEGQNRKKQYILPEGTAVPFLVELGVMNEKGEVIKAKYDKFKQINRFLEFIRDILPALPQDREIRILDFGCGKSYLTFAVYYYLHEVCGMEVSITGLDLKKQVIEDCNVISRKYGYEKLNFARGDIAAYQDSNIEVDMVMTLHACDTATDYALAKAVNWGAKVILSVPCCQHELNRQIQNDCLSPALRYGIIRERMSALLTDAIRAEVLRTKGYRTDILEFVDMEHTPKNLLIRAVLGRETGNPEALRQMTEALGVKPTIMELLD